MTLHPAKILDINSAYLGVSSETLMENATQATLEYLLKHHNTEGVYQVFCGSGNNGADGYLLASKLQHAGKKIEVCMFKKPKTALAKKHFENLSKQCMKPFTKMNQSKENIIIDALIGVGLEGKVKKNIADIITKINKLPGSKIALDTSSGGLFVADVVISFHNSKKENKNFNEVVLPIGIPKEAELHFGPGDVIAHFPKREKNSHKGQNGNVLIIGGNENIHGAPLITLLGSQSICPDLVTLFIPKKHENITTAFSEEIFVHTFEKDFLTLDDSQKILELAKNVDVVIIGPGLGKEKVTQKAIIHLLANLHIPCIIDADAIMSITQYKKIPKHSVFTPHRNELFRLLHTEAKETFEDVFEKIPSLLKQKNNDFTLLVKGNIDTIFYKNFMRKNTTGTAILTRGGTGDFLAGMIGALIARKVDCFHAAGISSFLLGISAEKCEKLYGEAFSFSDLKKMVSKTLCCMLNLKM